MSEIVKGIIHHCKKAPAIIPIVVFSGAAALGAGTYLARLALQTPDGVGIINRQREPHNRYEKKNYKFWTYFDAENYEHPRPRYD
ncbi:cytochrome c oxidase subunit NDUFA4-like [Panonychus citri]|uniref:cytochrome c oxidase subunit NDUFA4-like n=1 Tax=Panonychus citri TaxID=50023 RepID=UPI002307FC04|nr:cytochrome c oxidase subunit NDUFA4-like [Panonychus citri]